MKAPKISRRTLLRGLGATAALAPFLPPLELFAQSLPQPKRVIFLCTTNNTIYESWLPSMVAGQLALSPILQPLAEFTSKLLVVDGLGYNVAWDNGWRGHHTMTAALTGRQPMWISNMPVGSPMTYFGQGISLDQHIANTLCEGLQHRSLQAAVMPENTSPEPCELSRTASKLAYVNDGVSFYYNQPLPPERDPVSIYRRLFGNFIPPGSIQSPDPAALRRLAEKRSVLDFVRKDLNRFRGRVGTVDRQKIDAHTEAIRGIELNLSTPTSGDALATCQIPPMIAPYDVMSVGNIPYTGRLHIDLMVMALACDMTRVGTLQYGYRGATHAYDFVGVPGVPVGDDVLPPGIHGLVHYNSPDSRAQLVKVYQWYAGELAYLLGRLQSIPEGNGTMLDNTLVVWFTEFGDSPNPGAQGVDGHGYTNVPWVLAGNVGGYFNTGRLVSAPGQPHNRLLLALCHAFGLGNTSFGDPAYGSTPLTGLT